LIATALTVLVSALPFVHQAYENHSAHAAIETGAALVAWMASYLVFLRFRRSGLLNDLLLASALALLAATNLFFLAIPAAFASGSAEEAAMWAAVVGGALGAVTLAGAAFATPRPLKQPAASAAFAGFVLALTLVLVSVIVFVFEDRLALGIDPATAPDGSSWPQPTGNLPLLALQACTGLAYALSAVGFSRRAASTGDQLISWVAIACVLGAAARENYVLFPSLYTDWVYSGDILRTAAYFCLAVGAVREVNAYHRSLTKVAVLEERRRLARDFHDGLAQELAYVVAYGRNLARTTSDPAARGLVAAAERALDEARGAIGALKRQTDEPLDAALADTASEIAQREGATVKLDLAPGVRVSSAAQDALVRVVREAVTNAIRHGHASTVKVQLDGEVGVHLRIEDDGQGFDVSESVPNGHFGLTSMQERTRALGGEFRVVSHVGVGTAVEVTLP
jgi:signal transduction histidine kinase